MDQLPITSDQLALYTKIQHVSLGQDASPLQGYPPAPPQKKGVLPKDITQ